MPATSAGPSGHAGQPILGQIRSHGVTDVLVVVVRYFGGIKLGTSGLTAAYREAACMALDDAGRCEMHRMTEVRVEVPYMNVDGVMRLIKESGITVLERDFNNVCALRLSMRSDEAESILGRMSKTEGIRIELTE